MGRRRAPTVRNPGADPDAHAAAGEVAVAEQLDGEEEERAAAEADRDGTPPAGGMLTPDEVRSLEEACAVGDRAEQAVAVAVARVQGAAELVLELLDESTLNPRKTFDPQELEELTASIREHGVLQPILVRPRPGGRFEVVAGDRRRLGAIAAGLATIPATVREMTDVQALEVAVVENSQRADVPPLEEAEGFERLAQMGHYRNEDLAAKTGKSVQLVARRRSLMKLCPAGRAALAQGEITLSVAELLARVPDDETVKTCLKALKPRWEGDGTKTFAQAKRIILGHHARELKTAPFDPAAADLVPEAGPCAACPYRAGNEPHLFAGDVDEDTCTRPTCWDRKVAAHGMRALAAAREAGKEILTRAAKNVFRGDWNDSVSTTSKYVSSLREPAYEVDRDGNRTWAQVLGKDAPPTRAAATAPSGRVVELWHKDDLLKAARAKGVKPRASASSTRGPVDPSQARLQRLAKIRAEVLRRAQALLVTAAEARSDLDEEWWRVIALSQIEHSWPDVCSFVAKRRGLVEKGKRPEDLLVAHAATLNADQLRGLFVELTASKGTYLGQYSEGFGKSIRTASKYYGVHLDRLRKKVEAEFKARPKKAGPKRARAAAKGSKAKRKRNPWAGLSDAERLKRVNLIRRGKGLPEKAAL